MVATPRWEWFSGSCGCSGGGIHFGENICSRSDRRKEMLCDVQSQRRKRLKGKNDSEKN